MASGETVRHEPLERVKKQEQGRGDELEGQNGVESLEAHGAERNFGTFDCSDRAKHTVSAGSLQENQRKQMKLTERSKPAKRKGAVRGRVVDKAPHLGHKRNGDQGNSQQKQEIEVLLQRCKVPQQSEISFNMQREHWLFDTKEWRSVPRCQDAAKGTGLKTRHYWDAAAGRRMMPVGVPQNMKSRRRKAAPTRESRWIEEERFIAQKACDGEELLAAQTALGMTRLMIGSQQGERVVNAEEFVGFGAGDAGVGGQAVVMIEAFLRRPWRQRGFAELGEAFLEAVESFAGAGIARGDGAAGAGIAAFKVNVTDGEADGAAIVGAKELIFPEGGDAVDFDSGAEAQA